MLYNNELILSRPTGPDDRDRELLHRWYCLHSTVSGALPHVPAQRL